jgi:hypothetical protein
MDQAQEVPKILILRKEEAAPSDERWARLLKALKAFAEPTEEICSAPLGPDEIAAKSAMFTQVFLDLSLVHFATFGEISVPNLTLVRPDSFAWNSPAARSLMLPVLSRHSCLLLEELAPKDLIRLLHLYLLPKRLAGATPLLEKGSVVIGEKVQSVENLGSLLDKLTAFAINIEGFSLASRISDLRQTLGALLTQAFARACESSPTHPTVDFQVGLTHDKIVVNLRFPRGNLDPAAALLQTIDGRDLFWQQIWLCSDQTLITHHTQYDELEIMLVISRPQRAPLMQFRSILTKVSNRSNKKDNLLVGSANFMFRILSNVRLREDEKISLEISQDLNQIDFGSLPETVLKKLSAFAAQSAYQKEQLDSIATQFRDAQLNASQFAKELSQKKNELVRLAKVAATQQENFQGKVAKLETQIEHLKNTKTQESTASNSSSTNQLKEAVSKLEGTLRATENEKNQMAERLSNEQKKLALIEQRYSTLYKEIAAKDKEIKDLKVDLIKLRKEGISNAASVAASSKQASTDSPIAKIKDLEAREAALKQELRKVAFRLENQEKNLKVIQTEATEKAKLMEQKLQAAKTKELELLKRIEELSNSLKKSARAA